jgi:hypothetical protein
LPDVEADAEDHLAAAIGGFNVFYAQDGFHAMASSPR